MRAPIAIALAAALSAAGCSKGVDTSPVSEARAASPTGGDARHPVVLELFQSQGCSSCPPANANVNALADRPDVLALSFGVTYWDQLGWKDRFAQPAFTERQWDYAHVAKRSQVFTPQIVVDGRTAITGIRRAELDEAIARLGPVTGGPELSARGNPATGAGQLTIPAGKTTQPATVWLAEYDPRVREVPVSAGENNGRTLPHRNIVRRLVALGTWTGRSMTLPLPARAEGGNRSAVLVQEGRGGPIVAAIKL